MNYNSIDYFIALWQEKSFTKAAERLHITQQTLSAHIALLEKEMNCQLVVRRIPLEFTWPGEVFYKNALSIRRKTDDFLRQMADAVESKTGVLHLGVSYNRARVILPDIFLRYGKEYPGIHLELIEGVNDLLRKKLTEGDIDLAIAQLEGPLPGIETAPFYEEEIVLLLPKKLVEEERRDAFEATLEKEDGSALSFLARCPFLMTDNESVPGRIGREAFAKAGIEPPIRVASNNLELLLDLCRMGYGAVFSPEQQAKKILKKKDLDGLYILHFPHATQQISFGYRKELRDWKPLSAFMAIAKGKNKEEMLKDLPRCHWANPRNPLYVAYHDEEWGRPVHEDRKLFEMLLLEFFQSGLSWETILNRRENFRRAFENFDPVKIAKYDGEKVKVLAKDPGIIRSSGKVQAAVDNAKVFLAIQKEWGSFADYLWHFTKGEIIVETGKTASDLSDAVSKDLKARGMTYVGTTVIYAYLQAVGIIDGHEKGCFLHRGSGQ